jgi:large subunit ribosomal protein L20
MPRAVDGTRRHDRRKKILKAAKGYWGRRSTNFRAAKDAVAKAGLYAFRDRRKKKSDFRRLWISRISAGCRSQEISYSRFMNGLNKAGVEINRKALSNMAIEDVNAFNELVKTAKSALGA